LLFKTTYHNPNGSTTQTAVIGLLAELQVPASGQIAEKSRIFRRGLQEDVNRLQNLRLKARTSHEKVHEKVNHMGMGTPIKRSHKNRLKLVTLAINGPIISTHTQMGPYIEALKWTVSGKPMVVWYPAPATGHCQSLTVLGSVRSLADPQRAAQTAHPSESPWQTDHTSEAGFHWKRMRNPQRQNPLWHSDKSAARSNQNHSVGHHFGWLALWNYHACRSKSHSFHEHHSVCCLIFSHCMG